MAQAYLSPANAEQRMAIAQWRDGILFGYFTIIGAAFGARAIRNALERGRRRLVSISYPGRTVRVPRGWTVLEASRSFHIPHASMCGGRARCSTCRVRVTAGDEVCPTAERDERATLERIGAPPDVRLACQLRPRGDISVIPLMRTERPVYRLPAAQPSAEREIVVLFCDFLNRGELAGDHMPQDLLYLLMRYVDAIGHAIRMADGMLSSVRPDSICALFGLECGVAQAARQALRAGAAIEGAIADLNDRLGREGDSKVRVAVSIHAGRAAVGEIGQSDPPTVMAVGEAMDVVQELRKAVAEQRQAIRDIEAGISGGRTRSGREGGDHGPTHGLGCGGCGLALRVRAGFALADQHAARRTRRGAAAPVEGMTAGRHGEPRGVNRAQGRRPGVRP